MAITRQQKEQHVQELNILISKSDIIIVWNYLGLSATEISEIRGKIRNENAVNTVYKNRIAKIAFKENGKEEIVDLLEGPSSFLFIENDDSKALSELNKYIAKNDKLSFKAGYINGVFYDAKTITELAGLPSKDDLLSMLLSALQGTMRNLAYVISQIVNNDLNNVVDTKIVEKEIASKVQSNNIKNEEVFSEVKKTSEDETK